MKCVEIFAKCINSQNLHAIHIFMRQGMFNLCGAPITTSQTDIFHLFHYLGRPLSEYTWIHTSYIHNFIPITYGYN